MLDDFAIHVGNVERAVRRVGHLHRTEPVVPAREKLDLLFVLRPLRYQPDAVGKKLLAMDQIASAVRHEGVPVEILRERIAAVDRDAGRAAEIAGGPAAALDRPRHQTRHAPARANHAPRFIRAEPVNRRRRTVPGDVHRRRRKRAKRISPPVPLFIHHLANVRAVAANEFAAPIIEAQAILAAAALQPQPQSAGIEGEIVTAQIH